MYFLRFGIEGSVILGTPVIVILYLSSFLSTQAADWSNNSNQIIRNMARELQESTVGSLENVQQHSQSTKLNHYHE